MTHIQTIITSASSFIELEPIIRRAKSDISFWGERYIRATGYEGSCPLDTLTRRVIELFKRRQKVHFNKEERRAGIVLKEKIDQFYLKTDSKIKGKNLLTRLFFIIYECWICHIHNAGYGPRFDWRSNNIFLAEMEERLKIY